MSKSQKELAFLRDLSITKDWTQRFTDFTDKHLSLPAEGNFLYFNAGTLSHALELREKLDKDVNLTCVCENIELRHIAEDKAAAVKAKITFGELDDLQSESFDNVLADLTFVKSNELEGILDELLYLTKKGGRVSFFLPTAGSFGEIFSFLWETFLGIELIEKSAEIERLINEIPTISHIEDLAKDAGLKNISSETNKEVFEYDSGKDFISSTLLTDFFFPIWLNFLSEKEQKQTLKKLSEIIDEEHSNLTFRFTVKADFISGIKS